MKNIVAFLLLIGTTGSLAESFTNISFSPPSVPHGEVVVIDCIFNISLSDVGLIIIETSPDNQLYEYQQGVGVVDEDYADRIISDSVDEGLLRLEMISDIYDRTTYFCIVIDADFESYLSSALLDTQLPLMYPSVEPAAFKHGDRVTVKCEFYPLPPEIWNKLTLGITSTATELLSTQNSYPTTGKRTTRYGNSAAVGYYEMVTAKFTDNSVEGTMVASYPVNFGENITCSLTDFQGNISVGSTEFNVVTDHYVTITPNPAVIGEEVEFRCQYGYYTDYNSDVFWVKDDEQFININHWAAASTFTTDGIVRSVEGDGFYSFTKIAQPGDEGVYGCRVDTIVNVEVGFKYINLTLTEPEEPVQGVQDTISTKHEAKKTPEKGLVNKEELKVTARQIRKKANLKKSMTKEKTSV